MKNFSIAIVAMILLSFLSPVVAMQPKDDEVSVMTPVIIEFNDKVDKKLLENNGGKIKIEYKLRPAVAASLPPKAIENLRKNPNIKSIVTDIEIHTMEYGTSYFSDWGIKQIGADKVHNNGIKGETINVAILDTGADLDHPDLVSNIVYSYDFSGFNDPDASDRNGHGTHVAGTVGALLNSNGVVGVAPDVNLYILKVFTDSGRGSYSDVIEALEWCYLTHGDSNSNNDIQIVSMSLGSEYADGDPDFEDLVDTLYDVGILLVGAAGNSGSANDNVIYPARYENVIAVAATDINNYKASFSSTGPAVEISAPGVLIRSTYKNDRYATMSGTSMATPHLAGTAALVMAANPGISNVEVRQILRDTADDRGEPGRDTSYGFGLVDAYEAAVPIGTNQPPVADAGADQTINDADDNNIETVTLDGSASDDPDGSIVSYEWKIGDNVLGDTGILTYDFTVGVHTVTLTVQDDGEATSSDNVIVTVNANQIPVADAGADQTVNDADDNGMETVTLDGSASDDPDGSIVSYEWKIGDNVLGDTGILTYDFTVGVHTVTLTVQDDGEATSSDDVIVTVNEATASPTLHIASIDMSTERIKLNGWYTYATATVYIVNASGYPIEGAAVSGDWSGLTSDTDSGPTDSHGKIALDSDLVKNAVGTFTFTVTEVTYGEFKWDGVQESGDITV